MCNAQNLRVGDQFVVPLDEEFQRDVFTTTRVRENNHGVVLDGVCDGDESISISVNLNEIERF